MKVVYILSVTLPIMAATKPSLKLQLLTRLLETLNERDNYLRKDTRNVDDGIYSSSTVTDLGVTVATTGNVGATFSTGDTDFNTDNTQHGTETVGYQTTDPNEITDIVTEITDSETHSAISEQTTNPSLSEETASTPTQTGGNLPQLPPVDKDAPPLNPEEYIRHVTEGMCVMLAYVKGLEQTENMVKRSQVKKFPWKKAESILEKLCKLLDTYNAEPIKLAEAFVKQMAEHKGTVSDQSNGRFKTMGKDGRMKKD